MDLFSLFVDEDLTVAGVVAGRFQLPLPGKAA